MKTAKALLGDHVRSIGKFDRLGGSDSVWGRKHVFEELLKEEHEKAGEPSEGMYRFKKMGWYGNIVSFAPSVAAMAAFLELGYTEAHLQEFETIYAGGMCRGAIDEVTLASYMRSAFKSGVKRLAEGLKKAEGEVHG